LKIKRANEVETEPTTSLGGLSPTSVFRFAHNSFDDAMRSEGFYMVIDAPERPGVVTTVCLADGKQLVRDKEHRVIVHKAEISISPTKKAKQ
jgi:hypothetical protein